MLDCEALVTGGYTSPPALCGACDEAVQHRIEERTDVHRAVDIDLHASDPLVRHPVRP